MEIAALTLNVAARLQANQEWTPTLGVLFVRFLTAPWSHEVEFGYSDDPKDPAHYRSIARIRNWQSEPNFGGTYDCAKGEIDRAGSGASIVRRHADRDDVEGLMLLWRHRIPLAEWMSSVESEEGLCAASKALIREVFAEHTKS